MFSLFLLISEYFKSRIGKKRGKNYWKEKKFCETFRVETNSIFFVPIEIVNRESWWNPYRRNTREKAWLFSGRKSEKIFSPRNLNSPFQRSTSSRLNSNYSRHLKTDVISELARENALQFFISPMQFRIVNK